MNKFKHANYSLCSTACSPITKQSGKVARKATYYNVTTDVLFTSQFVRSLSKWALSNQSISWIASNNSYMIIILLKCHCLFMREVFFDFCYLMLSCFGFWMRIYAITKFPVAWPFHFHGFSVLKPTVFSTFWVTICTIIAFSVIKDLICM